MQASASQYAADELSPGTTTSTALRRAPPWTATVRPSSLTSIFAPCAVSSRSVWSREAAGDRAMVTPSVWTPASSTHDLTWALATGEA